MIALDDDKPGAPRETVRESVPCAYDLAGQRRGREAVCAFDVSDGVPRPTTAPALAEVDPDRPAAPIVLRIAPDPASDPLPAPLPGQVIELLPAPRSVTHLRLGGRTITIEHSGSKIYLDLRDGAPICLTRAEVRRLITALEGPRT
jgi:hypothetical protein